MNIRRIMAPLACTVVAIAGATTVGRYQQQRSRAAFFAIHPAPRAESEAEGRADDPEGRDRWDWMRLRDPATGRIPENIRARELAYAATLPVNAPRAAFLKTLAGAASGYDWRLRGPSNVGGRTRALALDVNDENVILAGGITGGMWRSTDAGASWLRTTTASQLPSVTCIAQDTRPGHANTWYYGTGEFRTNVQRFGNANYYGNGIYKSTDDGRSWQQLVSTAPASSSVFSGGFQFVNNVVADPSDTADDLVYAAVYGGIMRSADGGATWTETLGSGTNAAGFTNVALGARGTVYATLGSGGATHGVWRSPDGIHWTDITPNSWWSDSTRGAALDVSPTDSTVVYFLAETPGKGLKVLSSYTANEWYSFWKYQYKSGNGSGGGGTWTNLSLNLPYYGLNSYNYADGRNYNGLASYALVVKASPFDANTIFFGGTDLYITTDNLATAKNVQWLGGYTQTGQYSDSMSLHPDQHALAFSHSSARIFVGNDGGVFTTLNPYTPAPQWTSLDNGYYTGQFYSTAIDFQTTGSAEVLGGLQDNGTWGTDTVNAGYPWDGDYSGGDGSFCAIADSGSSLYVSSQYGAVIGYVAGAQYPAYFPNNYADLFVCPFAIDPNNSGIMYMPGGAYLWRNANLKNDPYSNWSELYTTQTPDGSDVTALGVTTANPPHRVYYGTGTGKLYRLDGADRGAPLPVNVTGAGFPAGGWINCVAVDPVDGARAIAVFSNYNVLSLFSTTNAGASWSPVGGNLEQHPDGTGEGPSCRWAAILHRGSDTLYLVGASTGLYSTTSLRGMQTIWQQEGASTIGNEIVNMVEARQSDGYVAAATWGGGMYSAMIPTINVPVVPGPVALVSPPDQSTAQPLAPMLVWQNSGTALDYHLQVYNVLDTLIFDDAAVHDTSYTLPPLAANATYRWHVSAINEAGEGAFSPMWSFTTGPSGVPAAQLPQGLALEQNYPNPVGGANDLTTIRFSIPANSGNAAASINIYDMQGRLVRPLLFGSITAGAHKLTMDAGGLPNGAYMYRLRWGGYSITRSLQVAR